MFIDSNLVNVYENPTTQNVENLLLYVVQNGMLDEFLGEAEKGVLINELEALSSSVCSNMDAHNDSFAIYRIDPNSRLTIDSLLEKVLAKEGSLRDTLVNNGLTQSKIEFVRSEKKAKRDFINSLSYDMTMLISNKKDFNILGRDLQVESCITTLCRKNKQNPLLIGEAGVGKTAIVEELCSRINRGCVPEPLKGKKVWSLQLNRILSKTKYRGEFEEKITKLLDLFIESGDIIFLDEIHTVINAGDAEGGLSSANILKPYLARDDIKFIGATTLAEYQELILPDSALERRFGIVYIPEFTTKEMLQLYRDLVIPYEDFHRVKFDDISLQEMIGVLSEEYPTRHFPDKFLDLVDYTGARFSGTDIKINLQYLRESLALNYEFSQ